MKVSYLKSFASVENGASGDVFRCGVIDSKDRIRLIDEIAGQPSEPFFRVASVRNLMNDLKSIVPDRARIDAGMAIIEGKSRWRPSGVEAQSITIEGRQGKRVARMVSRIYHIPLSRPAC